MDRLKSSLLSYIIHPELLYFSIIMDLSMFLEALTVAGSFNWFSKSFHRLTPLTDVFFVLVTLKKKSQFLQVYPDVSGVQKATVGEEGEDKYVPRTLLLIYWGQRDHGFSGGLVLQKWGLLLCGKLSRNIESSAGFSWRNLMFETIKRTVRTVSRLWEPQGDAQQLRKEV